MYVCFPLPILRSEMLSSKRKYHPTTITSADVWLKMTKILKEQRIAQMRLKSLLVLFFTFWLSFFITGSLWQSKKLTVSTLDSSEGCNFHGPVQLPPFMLYPKLDINLAHLLKISGKDSIFFPIKLFLRQTCVFKS